MMELRANPGTFKARVIDVLARIANATGLMNIESEYRCLHCGCAVSEANLERHLSTFHEGEEGA